MKIIAFPFAGGNSYSYKKLFNKNDGFIALDYPGRGRRYKEPLLLNVKDLVDDMFERVKEQIDNCDEYVIYGHSMGALIAYLVCKKIESINIKKPNLLIVSGSRAPIFPRREKIAHLPNDEFWNKVVNFGGMPDSFDDHPDLINFYRPILRADFECIENYIYNETSAKLSIPINVFYGAGEHMLESEINAWKEETTAHVNIKKLAGNHFFIFENLEFSRAFLDTIYAIYN